MAADPAWGLLISIVAIAVIAGVGWWSGRGKTNADDLKAGDCFKAPTAESGIDSVEHQSCAGTHEAEIYAVVNLPEGSPYPSDDMSAAEVACGTALDSLTVILENIPEDTLDGTLFPDRPQWGKDRKVLCYASSATGFPGPIIDR
ncbi:MAG: hypothetical protein R2695_14130 [Acidimicrobiales bacterium]